MGKLFNALSLVMATIGLWLGLFLGPFNGLLIALVCFILADYVTGIVSAIINKTMSSADHPELYNYVRRRTWQAHGRIKFVEYEEDDMTNTIICPCCGAKLTAQLTLSPAEDLLDIYTVQDGDSPWSIAVKYYQDGTLYYKIMDYNGLARNAYIYGGQQLKIPRL